VRSRSRTTANNKVRARAQDGQGQEHRMGKGESKQQGGGKPLTSIDFSALDAGTCPAFLSFATFLFLARFLLVHS
jgi:hypothetical protein